MICCDRVVRAFHEKIYYAAPYPSPGIAEKKIMKNAAKKDQEFFTYAGEG